MKLIDFVNKRDLVSNAYDFYGTMITNYFNDFVKKGILEESDKEKWFSEGSTWYVAQCDMINRVIKAEDPKLYKEIGNDLD